MDKALFEDLVQSLKEAKAIAHGEAEASRRITVAPADKEVAATLRTIQTSSENEP